MKLQKLQQKILSNSIFRLSVAFLDPREIKMGIVESDKNGINAIDVNCCADKQTFGADIKVSIDIDGYVGSKSVRCLFRIVNAIFQKLTF